MKTRFPTPSRRSHRGVAQTLRSQALESSRVLRRLVAEIEAMATGLQQGSQDLDRCDLGDEDTVYQLRERLRGLKQVVRDRLPGITQEAYPWIVAAEFWKPGLLSAFGEFWPGLPDPLQGPATWLGFMGRLRAALLEAINKDPARTGKVSSNLAESDRTEVATGQPTVGPSLGPGERLKENYRVKEVAKRWSVDTKTAHRRLRGEAGVMHLKTKTKKGHARERSTLLIPAHVLQRVERSMTLPARRDNS